VSYVLEKPGELPPEELAGLKAQVEQQRSKEKRDG